MRRGVWVLLVMLPMLTVAVAPPAGADPPRFTVNWRFEVKFGDGTQTYNENADLIVPVRIPRDFGWECNRNTPVLVDGRSRSGFGCTSDGWKTNVLLMTGCKVGALEPLHAAALRLFAARTDGKLQGDPVDAGASGSDAGPASTMGKWIDVAVSCETVAAVR